jgi:hypothetical protein
VARYRELRARAESRIAAAAAQIRGDFVTRHAPRLAARCGITTAQATRILERQGAGVLLPAVELPFDDPELAGHTVAQVLADPERYVGETLADPLEGVDYGRGKAKIMRRADISLWTNSFAHGRTVYDLKHDGRSAEAILNETPAADLAAVFVRLVVDGDIDPGEVEALRELVSSRAKIGKRALDSMLRETRRARAAAQAQQHRAQQLAQRQDPRPLILAPSPDGEWLPVMTLLNEVHGRNRAPVPPVRDSERGCTELRAISVPSLTQLSKEGANP